jgi:hypothetical protein
MIVHLLDLYVKFEKEFSERYPDLANRVTPEEREKKYSLWYEMVTHQSKWMPKDHIQTI